MLLPPHAALHDRHRLRASMPQQRRSLMAWHSSTMPSGRCRSTLLQVRFGMDIGPPRSSSALNCAIVAASYKM
jgi:hypothetical protein